jgi:hypothetical protein
MMELYHIPEPRLRFRHAQDLEDPRDGLTLFGPLDAGKPFGIRVGVIGTPNGIADCRKWLRRIQGRIHLDKPRISRPPFPGFEAVFQTPLKQTPEIELTIDEAAIDRAIYQSDRYQRVYAAVDLYAGPILKSRREDDVDIDLWLVVVPDRVRKYCRPRQNVETALRIKSQTSLSESEVAQFDATPFLFPSINEQVNAESQPYRFEPHFHNQLKARLLADGILTQVLLESTVSDPDAWSDWERRQYGKLNSSMAWNISTAIFYKSGGRPWKLSFIRPGVCYVGIVFKQDSRSGTTNTACCAAQMFLDSGDGLVFKGAIGPWYNPKQGDFHLQREPAAELMRLAVESYQKSFNEPPRELFIHGKTVFNDEEWAGFSSIVDDRTKLVGVSISEGERLKLFSSSTVPVLRGTASVESEYRAFLWTRGFVPRLQTYVGMEVPNPLRVYISKGDADIQTVLADLMALTKLNYNSCIYSDGEPVTLKFADTVGEILTAGPVQAVAPLPFRHYI